MKKYLVLFFGLLLGAMIFSPAVFACQIIYNLIDPKGVKQAIVPSNTIHITKGETYTLRIDFYEDHRNCNLPPNKTLFLLNDKVWEHGKTNLPLELLGPVRWQTLSSRYKVGTLQFKALQSGTFTLEILRECVKERYEEEFRIRVN